MRIIAGSLRGKPIDAPDGLGTRPTTDRVREALFSSLYSLLGGFEGLKVVDAFAGSGALGIEALSRGADYAAFFEHDRKAASVLKRNLDRCGLGRERASVTVRDAFKSSLPAQDKPFDLVFFDPPYADDAAKVLGLAQSWRNEGALGPHATIVYEHGLEARKAMATTAESLGMAVIAEKKYGKTAITLLGFNDDSDERRIS